MDKQQTISEPSAPMLGMTGGNQMPTAPPSYEESIYASGPVSSQPPQYTLLPQGQTSQHNSSGDHEVSPLYNPAQYAHIHQHHYYQLMTNILPGPPIAMPSNQPKLPEPKQSIVTLAKGAEIRTLQNGAISIPPPPPGCAPTPAQLAAMQGKPVVVKKQKRSFF